MRSRSVKKTATGLSPWPTKLTRYWSSLLASPLTAVLWPSVCRESGSLRSKMVVLTPRKKFRRTSVSRADQSESRSRLLASTSWDWAILVGTPLAGDSRKPSSL